jgi:hypothetical protein
MTTCNSVLKPVVKSVFPDPRERLFSPEASHELTEHFSKAKTTGQHHNRSSVRTLHEVTSWLAYFLISYWDFSTAHIIIIAWYESMAINDGLGIMWNEDVVIFLNVSYYYRICLQWPIEVTDLRTTGQRTNTRIRRNFRNEKQQR